MSFGRSGSLLAEISARYGLPELLSPVRLAGGEWNQVFRVEAGDRSILIRIAHPTLTPETLRFTHLVMEGVGLPEVAPPLSTASGDTCVELGGHVIAVFPFVPGERLSLKTVDVGQAGLVLGKIHRQAHTLSLPATVTLETLDWEENLFWRWSAVEEALVGPARDFAALLAHHRFDLMQLRDELQNWVASVGNFDRVCMHGDFYPGNLIGRDGRIVAVIDWDEARVEWPFWEVGRAMWECCHRPDWQSLDLPKAREFFAAYRSANPPDFPAALLVPVMRHTRLVDVLWDLDEAARVGEWDEENSDFHLRNLQAMEWLAGLEPSAVVF